MNCELKAPNFCGEGIIINNTNVPLTIHNQPSVQPDFDILVKKMQDATYYADLQVRMEENEREDQSEFNRFSDIDMIYYYVHRKTHIREDRNRTEGTKKEYLNTLMQFYRYVLGNQLFFKNDVPDYKEEEGFKNLRPRHIRHFHEYLSIAPLGKKGNPYTAATIQSKSAVLKAFLRWLNETGYLNYPLHEKIKDTSIIETEIPNKDFYPEEAFMLIDFYKNHPIHYALLTTLMITGLRVTELAKAKWRDISYDAATNAYWLEGVGKRNKKYLKRISPFYFERIKAYRIRRKLSITLNKADESPIFADRNLKHYSTKNLSNYIVKIILDSKLPFLEGRENRVTPHSFRHAYAIYLYRQGADLFTIQKELGHSDPKTTERYLEKAIRMENSAGHFISDDAF